MMKSWIKRLMRHFVNKGVYFYEHLIMWINLGWQQGVKMSVYTDTMNYFNQKERVVYVN